MVLYNQIIIIIIILCVKTPNYYKYKDNFPEEMKMLEHKNTMFKSFNGRTPNKDDVLESSYTRQPR